MARDRMIRKKFWDDKKLSKISRDARLLFIGIWNYADDYGVIQADHVWIKARVFPYDNIQSQQFDKWLVELSQSGFISRFSHKGEDFYYLPNFLKHQTINRPNYDDVYVKNFTTDMLNADSVINHGTITEQSVNDHCLNRNEIEIEMKENKKGDTRLSPSDALLAQNFIDGFNRIKKSKFQLIKKVEAALHARIKEGYTVERILQAVQACYEDKFHKENPQHLSPEFILRPDKLEKYANYQTQTVKINQNATASDYLKA